MLLVESGTAPRRSHALDWVLGDEARAEPFLDVLFARFCQQLARDGVPLDRATFHARTLHPQFLGARLLWQPGMGEAEILRLDHGALDDPRYLNSPIKALDEGADGFRQRLDVERPNSGDAFGIFTELRDQGFSDYVLMPVDETGGRRHAVSWATKRPGGFSTESLTLLSELLPVLGMVAEVRLKNRVTKNLLNTYVGRRAGEQILAGAITRGSGVTVNAAVWTCDLRGFTAISEGWPRDDVIQLLNDYFDTMAEPVERHGGEVLKFIGDALLAIFPLEDPDACDGAIRAALEARRGMRRLNAARVERGLDALGFGLALHVGDVMYGNIGSKERLDFTVIGPAVNVATRLEGLTKKLRRQVLISGPFVRSCPCGGLGLEPLGAFPLRGVGEPVEVYALPEPT